MTLLRTGVALIVLAWPRWVAAEWSITGPMLSPREGHTATMLSNGMVLVTGGADFGTNITASSELYDPSKGTWTVAGPLSKGRARHTATRMPDGTVLVAGGLTSTAGSPSFAAGAEIYDPITRTWTSTGAPRKLHVGHTATLLADGRVLVAGGLSSDTELVDITEVYDPASRRWQTVGSLNSPRSAHVAVLLPDGKVLVAGGAKVSMSLPDGSAELFDPASGTWSRTGSPLFNHVYATATLLADGRVLIAGGFDGTRYSTNAELYDPSSGTWSATGSLGTARGSHAMSPLSDERVLVAGGTTPAGNSTVETGSAELFDPTLGTWSPAGSLASARTSPTATLLSTGKVLIAGGRKATGSISSAELFEASSSPITALFPHLAVGGGFSTAFTFMNLGDTPVSGTLFLTGQDGTPLNVTLAPGGLASSSPLSIPAGGSTTITATVANAGDAMRAGWARVESTGGKLTGVANFQLASAGQVATTAGVLSSELVESATFPVLDDVSSNLFTGYAIANPNSSETLTIRVMTVKEDGTLAATLSSVTLRPSEQTARFLIEDPAHSRTFKGTAVLIGPAGRKFSVVALIQNNGLYSAIPVSTGKAPHIN